MNPIPKKDLSSDRLRKVPDDIAYYKLFMLNLHAAIESGYGLENIFQDMRQKCEGDYIFGKAFIADAAIDITQRLDSLIFYINSLSTGRDVGLFYLLDRLKSNLNKYFDRIGGGENHKKSKDNLSQESVSLPDLLKEITDFSTRIDLSRDSAMSATPDGIVTIHDLLIYCYRRIFEIMEERFKTIASIDGQIPGQSSSFIKLPISYLLQDGMPVFDNEIAEKSGVGDLYSNPGASKLCEGINEVFYSDLYAAFLQKSYRDINNGGVLLYSNETLVLYHISNSFESIVASNICDAVGGNYISLLVNSGSSSSASEESHRLFGKLLDWLDFHSFSAYGFTIASIGNMTRGDMENQLNTLGKLLAFVASTAITPRDDKTVQQNIEVFLENIV